MQEADRQNPQSGELTDISTVFSNCCGQANAVGCVYRPLGLEDNIKMDLQERG
jgi:hypothetical protein